MLENDLPKFYMNMDTGIVDTYPGWYYDDESGFTVNAVDRGEVVEVERTADSEDWQVVQD